MTVPPDVAERIFAGNDLARREAVAEFEALHGGSGRRAAQAFGVSETTWRQWRNGVVPRPTRAVGVDTRDARERLLRSVEIDAATGCWLWKLNRDPDGYGRGTLQGRTLLAHRISYELLVGPIPDGLYLDHLCMVPPCVNPAHLEPVTAAENTRRWNVTRTHCGKGHEFSKENTYTRSGRRHCRKCNNERQRRSHARKRGARNVAA